jgi:hypothetical protein
VCRTREERHELAEICSHHPARFLTNILRANNPHDQLQSAFGMTSRKNKSIFARKSIIIFLASLITFSALFCLSSPFFARVFPPLRIRLAKNNHRTNMNRISEQKFSSFFRFSLKHSLNASAAYSRGRRRTRRDQEEMRRPIENSLILLFVLS